MPNLHEIIAQMQRELFCPVCGKNYEVGEIRIRGLFDKTLIVQTTCENGHLTLFMTTIKSNLIASKLSNDDILDLIKTLKDFDGDFQKIWKL